MTLWPFRFASSKKSNQFVYSAEGNDRDAFVPPNASNWRFL